MMQAQTAARICGPATPPPYERPGRRECPPAIPLPLLSTSPSQLQGEAATRKILALEGEAVDTHTAKCRVFHTILLHAQEVASTTHFCDLDMVFFLMSARIFEEACYISRKRECPEHNMGYGCVITLRRWGD